MIHPASMSATALVVVIHGVFLALCGIYGAASHDWAPKAMHSAYAGGAGGLALFICGTLAALPSRQMYMIGVHLALLLQVAFSHCTVAPLQLASFFAFLIDAAQLVFLIVFTMQAYRSYGVPEKADRFSLFVVMAGSTLAALVAMRALKPQKKPKD